MDFDILRERMVEEQLVSRGIHDPRVLKAFRKIPRHIFVPEKFRDGSYADHPLPIGAGQTISQPYMVALMTECLALTGKETVLEIGTGSGYQTAILAELAKEVSSVERIDTLRQYARNNLDFLGYKDVKIKTGDGTLGWEEFSPYDAIIVTAGAPKVPDSLISQLNTDGKLVIPIGGSFSQMLTLIEKKENRVVQTDISGCVFVPLIGKEGWRA